MVVFSSIEFWNAALTRPSVSFFFSLVFLPSVVFSIMFFFGFIRCPQNQLYVFRFSRIISNVCEALLSSTSARSTSLVFLYFFHFICYLSSIHFSLFLWILFFFCIVFLFVYLLSFPICLFVFSFLSSYFVTFLYLILFVVVVFVCISAFYIFFDDERM